MSQVSQKRTWQAIALLLAFTLTIALVVMVPLAGSTLAQLDNNGSTYQSDAPAGAIASHRLIVQLQSPPLAELSASTGLARTANGRLDVRAPAAQAYVVQLESEQAAFIAAMSKALAGVSVASYINEAGQSVEATYQVVFNGVAVDPGSTDSAEARRILSQLPSVKAVFLDFAHQPQTYASMPLINAPALWNHSAVGGQDNAGDGVMFASMDGGVHHEAAMFDGTGFSYPIGPPFMGGGLGDAANNNGKIIVSRAYFRDWDPPDVGDENSWPGKDGTSHGVHTASTAAGNQVVADYLGITDTLSGVAPGAWVMSYRVFYDSVTHDGSFYNVEGIAALEDIAIDGADVLNNSWGGGPGSAGGEFDALDTALINVASAGTFVSMSTGNAGPGNGTTDHPSADYINVAATTTDGTYAAGRLNVIAPEPVSSTLQSMSFSSGLFGDPLPVGQTVTHTFITAASVDEANVTGCNAWAGTPFSGHAAVISRGGCNFGDKVYYAQAAGADFVVIYNNSGDGLINMSFACTYAQGCTDADITVSSIFIGQSNGEGMVAWYEDNGSASVLELDTTAYQAGNDADMVAGFSSRGPGVGNVLKPDIAAPGVNIMAQGYKPGAVGEERHLGYGQSSGTSMASPHVAGAAVLLRQIHPSWPNAAVKSALMSTSKYMEIYNGDGSPAQPLDIGAGRLDLTHAADPGLILDPPSLSFGAMITGTSKSIKVMVTSVATETETYDLSTLYTGAGFAITQTTELAGFSVTPISITVAPAATAEFTVTFDTADGMGIGDNQGYIIIAGDNGHHAHMPAWARVQSDPTDAADVLLIDNDFSYLLGYPDYAGFYADALDDLGMSFDYWNADAYFNNPATIPEAAVLSRYKAVIYFTGDNYYPDGSFTVATPLTELDQDRLTEYANGGGIIIAMGQDMSGVLDDSFFDDFVLGDESLQDSVTGYNLPSLPVVPLVGAPAAFSSIALDLSGIDWYVGHNVLPGATPDLPYKMYMPIVAGGSGPVLPAAPKGTATYAYDLSSGRLDYEVTISATVPVTVTASHLHQGSAFESGPPIYTLFSGPPTLVTDTFTFDGSLLIDAADEADLLAGGLYLNVHTTVRPAGAVRAQVALSAFNDGANNQYYIDEMMTDPWSDPLAGIANPYAALLTYPGKYNMADGVVAMAHRDQPTLENPGTAYYGRSIYTSFGLEGVNDSAGFTSRAALLDTFFSWAMDMPAVEITVTSTYTDTGLMTVFEAMATSNITGTTGASYRWDFGDGSEFAGPYPSSSAGHAYSDCPTTPIRVEMVDSWGNRTIGQLDASHVTKCVP